MPDSDPDSDITVSVAKSDEISNFGDDSGESGIGGEHRDLQAEWTQNFGGICVDELDTPSGPQLPDEFDVVTATPIKYFDLLFPERIFEVLKNTNHYAEFCHDQRRIDQRNPNYEDTKWYKTSTDEMQALFGVMIIMSIKYLPQDWTILGQR